MKDLNDSEMNDFIIRYFISSVIKRNYCVAVSDISSLRQTYLQYDLNIYIFLLKIINGNFVEAAQSMMNVGQNLYEDVWKLVSRADLAFYFTLSLLIQFNRSKIKEVQVLNQSLIYKFLEDFPGHLELLENYSKCRFEVVTEEFEKIKEIIQNDPLLINNFAKINFEIKNNILKEVLNSCSIVSIQYLGKILKENELNKIENWIMSGISEGYLKAKIDDIDKLVYSQEINSHSDCIEKTLRLTRKTLNNSMIKIINNISPKSIDVRSMNLNEFKKYTVEKNKDNVRRN